LQTTYKDKLLTIKFVSRSEYEGFIDRNSISRGHDDCSSIERELIDFVDGVKAEPNSTELKPSVV
jgi:hypothetical protein